MKHGILLVLLACVALFSFGCKARNGQTVIRYDPNHPEPNQLTTVPQDGEYGLFAAGESKPLPPGLWVLKRGQRIGFIRRMGELLAVAGSDEWIILWDIGWTWKYVGATPAGNATSARRGG